jgi:hypothetical protein
LPTRTHERANTFAVIAYPPLLVTTTPAPATTTTPKPVAVSFSIGRLTITPASVEIGREVNISVTVSNTGSAAGNYEVKLSLNGLIVDSRTIHLDAGARKEVNFILTGETAGKQIIDVNGVLGGFTVLGEIAPPQQAPLPAEEASGTIEAVEPVTETAQPIEQPVTPSSNWSMIFGVAGGSLVAAARLAAYKITGSHENRWPLLCEL